MENSNNNNNDQLPEEQAPAQDQPGESQAKTATESNEQQKGDGDSLRNAQQDQPDAVKKSDTEGGLVGDVHPTTRVDTSQEEQNGDSQSQSEASKISGEQL